MVAASKNHQVVTASPYCYSRLDTSTPLSPSRVKIAQSLKWADIDDDDDEDNATRNVSSLLTEPPHNKTLRLESFVWSFRPTESLPSDVVDGSTRPHNAPAVDVDTFDLFKRGDVTIVS